MKHYVKICLIDKCIILKIKFLRYFYVNHISMPFNRFLWEFRLVHTCIPTTPYMKKTSIINNATYGSALKDLMKVHNRFRIDSLLPRSFTRLLKRKFKKQYWTDQIVSKFKVYIKIYASPNTKNVLPHRTKKP